MNDQQKQFVEDMRARMHEQIKLRCTHQVRVRRTWKGRRFCTACWTPDFMIVDNQIERRVIGRWP